MAEGLADRFALSEFRIGAVLGRAWSVELHSFLPFFGSQRSRPCPVSWRMPGQAVAR